MTLVESQPTLRARMDQPSLWESLRCPKCVQPLRLSVGDVNYGVLACSCSRYPVVEGIAVLRDAAAGERVNFARAASCIQRGNRRGALASCLGGSVGSPRRRFLGPLERITPPRLRSIVHRIRGSLNRRALSPASLTFRAALDIAKSNLFHQYLYHRFANPSLHAAIPVIALLKELASSAFVLDLACGMGHSSFLIKSMFPQLNVVMADHDFTNLYLAKRFFSPDSAAVCLDAEARLPFADGTFDAGFCMDAFHYMTAKTALAREIDRVVEADGILLLPHLHNAMGVNPVPGMPLTPARYLSLWSDRNIRAFSEHEILSRFVGDGTIDLTNTSAPTSLERANALTLIAGQPDRLWRKHGAATLYQSSQPVGFNPLYRVEPGPPIRLHMQWDGPQLRDECAAALEYMPAVREVASSDLSELSSAERQSLLREFVLVPLPANYSR